MDTEQIDNLKEALLPLIHRYLIRRREPITVAAIAAACGEIWLFREAAKSVDRDFREFAKHPEMLEKEAFTRLAAQSAYVRWVGMRDVYIEKHDLTLPKDGSMETQEKWIALQVQVLAEFMGEYYIDEHRTFSWEQRAYEHILGSTDVKQALQAAWEYLTGRLLTLDLEEIRKIAWYRTVDHLACIAVPLILPR